MVKYERLVQDPYVEVVKLCCALGFVYNEEKVKKMLLKFFRHIAKPKGNYNPKNIDGEVCEWSSYIREKMNGLAECIAVDDCFGSPFVD